MSTISTCANFVKDLKELTVISEEAVGTFDFRENGGFAFGIIFNEVDKLSTDPECERTIIKGFAELFPAHTFHIEKDGESLVFIVSWADSYAKKNESFSLY